MTRAKRKSAWPEAIANDDLKFVESLHRLFVAINKRFYTHHRFLPPSTATGIPDKISTAPAIPYAGSMTMLKGTQSSPSLQVWVLLPGAVSLVSSRLTMGGLSEGMGARA